jgi:hypothetical protein
MAKNTIEKLFSGCLGPFFLRIAPNDLVMGLILSLDIELYIPPTCGPLSTFLGLFGGAQIAPKWWKNSIKNLFTVWFGPLLLKDPNDLVWGIF